jgi:hypothetical protein
MCTWHRSRANKSQAGYFTQVVNYRQVQKIDILSLDTEELLQAFCPDSKLFHFFPERLPQPVLFYLRQLQPAPICVDLSFPTCYGFIRPRFLLDFNAFQLLDDGVQSWYYKFDLCGTDKPKYLSSGEPAFEREICCKIINFLQ